MPALNVLKKWLPHGTRLAHWPSQGWLLETWDSPCFYQYLHLGYWELGFTKILTGLKILTGEVGLNFEASLQLCLFLRGQLYPMLFCLSVMKDVDIRRLFPGLSVLFHPSECYTWTARSTGRCKSAWHVQAREQAQLTSHFQSEESSAQGTNPILLLTAMGVNGAAMHRKSHWSLTGKRRFKG